jgi:hypothetical protein
VSRPTISFEAAFVPRFVSRENSSRLVENHCAQQTFWTAIQELLSARTAINISQTSVVEFRLIAEPNDRRNRVVLNVYNLPAEDDTLQSVIRALPPDYGWHSIPTHVAAPSNSLVTDWYVSRIERRLNFVDLPWRLLDTLDTQGVQASSAAHTSSWSSLDNDQQRRLITRPVTRGEEEFERLCLPISGSLEISVNSLRVFFQEFRAQAPCVVSLAVAPVDPSRMDIYRRIAMFWSAHLHPFGPGMANAGFASLEALRFQYDRFLLPDRFLCVLTMRVAAPSSVIARSVALHVSARLGGLRSFSIRDPVLMPLEGLGDPWADVPHRTRWDA